MKQKIIFIGIHNKPELGPLDSSTKSGKFVDEIILHMIDQGYIFEYVKSNLYEVNYYPESENKKKELRKKWIEKYNPGTNDILILLGKLVQCDFFYNDLFIKIKSIHPSALWSKDKKWLQQDEIINRIKSHIK